MSICIGNIVRHLLRVSWVIVDVVYTVYLHEHTISSPFEIQYIRNVSGANRLTGFGINSWNIKISRYKKKRLLVLKRRHKRTEDREIERVARVKRNMLNNNNKKKAVGFDESCECRCFSCEGHRSVNIFFFTRWRIR